MTFILLDRQPHQPLKVLVELRTSWRRHPWGVPDGKLGSGKARLLVRASRHATLQIDKFLNSFSVFSAFHFKIQKATHCLHRQHSYECYTKIWSAAAIWGLFCELQSQNYVPVEESVVITCCSTIGLSGRNQRSFENKVFVSSARLYFCALPNEPGLSAFHILFCAWTWNLFRLEPTMLQSLMR